PVGATGATGPVGATGKEGPAVIWLSPSELVNAAHTNSFPNVTLESINVAGYSHNVVRIAESQGTYNPATAIISLPESWRSSGNVYATVYWTSNKTDGNIKMSIGYGGAKLGDVLTTAGYQEDCASTSPETAFVLQTCTKKISDVIYLNDHISIIEVNRYAYLYPELTNPDTNTGDLYIYGIKLENRS
ncbi:MAG: hypothetical protein ACO3E4_07080, partial [Candidatus Nanopelagicaceae bacterium]